MTSGIYIALNHPHPMNNFCDYIKTCQRVTILNILLKIPSSWYLHCIIMLKANHMSLSVFIICVYGISQLVLLNNFVRRNIIPFLTSFIRMHMITTCIYIALSTSVWTSVDVMISSFTPPLIQLKLFGWWGKVRYLPRNYTDVIRHVREL